MTLILITITVMFAGLLSYIYYYKEPLSNKEKYEELINKIRTDCIDDNKIRIIKLSSMHKYVIRFGDNNDLDIEINTLGNRWCSFDSIGRRNRDYFYYRIYEEGKLSDPYFVESSHLYNENKIAQMALRKEDENLILFKKNTEKEEAILKKQKEEKEYQEKINKLLHIKPLDKDLKEVLHLVEKKENLINKITQNIKELNKL